MWQEEPTTQAHWPVSRAGHGLGAAPGAGNVGRIGALAQRLFARRAPLGRLFPSKQADPTLGAIPLAEADAAESLLEANMCIRIVADGMLPVGKELEVDLTRPCTACKSVSGNVTRVISALQQILRDTLGSTQQTHKGCLTGIHAGPCSRQSASASPQPCKAPVHVQRKRVRALHHLTDETDAQARRRGVPNCDAVET